MKSCVAALGLAVAAAGASLAPTAAAQRCSSLNGPFCGSLGVEFAFKTPPYAAEDLDRDDQVDEQAELAKRVKIESVLKQYELQEEAIEDKEINIYVDVEMLLEEGTVMLGGLEDDQDSPLAGAFAFSSEGGAFELLEKMDGLELKEFFELALDEVLDSVEVALQDLSSEAAQGVRTTARQMKAVTDFSTYDFQRLDAEMQATIRRRFSNHRLVELQQTFERLVVARTAQDRQLAFEMSIFLFQLAQEEAAAEATTTEATSEVVGEDDGDAATATTSEDTAAADQTDAS